MTGGPVALNTPLQTLLIERIAASGPITLADYMSECLLHPVHGYYTTRSPFGTAGDFVTAPEISQMFGELIGLALAQAWLDQGAPSPFVLAELGPGRGTLMSDILRATRAVPGFQDAAQLALIEASPRLREVQAQTLAGHDPEWLSSVDDLPDGPVFAIANEFFDALPIRQFQRGPSGWLEVQVGAADGALRRGLSPEQHRTDLEHRLEDTAPGDIVERCPSAAPIIERIGTTINSNGGAMLIVDYGDWRSQGDTFQAVRSHKPEDPLLNPGAADLTAHVDFEALAAAAPCAHTRLTPQGVFLERLGITHRAQALASNLAAEALNAHVAAHRRLTHPDEMGTVFKVMGLYPDAASVPPGLEP
jgi:SAM-dependent MidA family methyltransferase